MWRVLMLGVAVLLLCQLVALSQQPSSAFTSRVLLLEDCDKDYQNPPFEDAVILFGRKGNSLWRLSNFNICETVGGCRMLAVAPDGRFFVISENVGNKITAYETKSGKALWSLRGGYTAATVAPGSLTYALTSPGTIYGGNIVLIDNEGKILKQEKFGGFDLTVDHDRGTIWLVGNKIRKCDLNLNLLLELDYVTWCAVSVDVAPDHSIWFAERQHPNVPKSTNRIARISSNGRLQKSFGLLWDPLCLRLNQENGSIWVTGFEVRTTTSHRLLESLEKRSGTIPMGKSVRDFLTKPEVIPKTHYYGIAGTLLQQINEGGHSIDLDRKDGSVWIAGRESLYHYATNGHELGRVRGVAPGQKYVAVIPEGTK